MRDIVVDPLTGVRFERLPAGGTTHAVTSFVFRRLPDAEQTGPTMGARRMYRRPHPRSSNS